MMSYYLGIDLGTTRTSAAVGHPGRPGEVVDLGDRSSAIPSVLYAAADGSVLVGDAAERRAITDPGRVVREFKRRIGDPTPIVVGGVAWSPQELAARVVRWVVDRVREREGGPATRVAVTHPASWGPLKRELLGGALAGQGVPVSFLAEPQAAALHYASTERPGPGSTIAVYDLGGGTFDSAVVHREAHGGFTLAGRPEGVERLGGIDFDQAVFDHVRAALPDAFAALDGADPSVLAAVAAVRRECSEAKEALSADTEVTIPVLLPGAQGSVRLHRTEFEAMIRPQIEETVTALRRAVTSAGFSPEQLTAVLLVGGSSRIPLVAQLVSEQLGRPVAVDADPKNAIALGAALSLDPTPVGHPGAVGHGSTNHGGVNYGSATYLSASHLSASHLSASHGSGANVPVPRGPIGTGRGPAIGAGMVGAGMVAGGGYGPGRPPGVPAPQLTGMPTSPTGTGAVPPTAVIGFGALPPQHPAPERPRRPDAEDRYWIDEDDGDERSARWPRRTPAVLVSAGGMAAALAVVAGLFLLPQQQPTTPAADQGPSSSGAVPSIGAPVETAPLPTSTEAVPTEPPAEPTPAPTSRPRRTPSAPPPVPTPPVTTPTPTPPPAATPTPTPSVETPTPTPAPTGEPTPTPAAGG